MPDYDNTNSGMLSRNERKKEPKHPDFTGQINVGGRDYWLSAWLKEGKAGGRMAGKKFFSLAVKPKEPAAGTAKPSTKPNPAQDGADDD